MRVNRKALESIMSEFFPALTDKQRDFIAKQPVFFVATAADGARINLSPKGMDSFRVLGPNLVGYLDVGGSGNETQAHLAADGRIYAGNQVENRGFSRAVWPDDRRHLPAWNRKRQRRHCRQAAECDGRVFEL